MSNSFEDKWFDSGIRKKYDNHKLSPDDKMWEKINAHLSGNNSVYILRQIRNLKIAVVLLAAALAGTLIYYEVRTSGKDIQSIELSGNSRTEENLHNLQQNNLPKQDKSVFKKSDQSVFTDTSKLSSIPTDLNPLVNTVGQGSTQVNNPSVTNAYSNVSPEILHQRETIDKLSVSSMRQVAGLSSNEHMVLHDKIRLKDFEDKNKKHARVVNQKREKLHTVPLHIFNPEHREPLSIIYSETVIPPGIKVTAGRGFLSGILKSETPLKGYQAHTPNRRFSFTLYLSPAYSYRILAENKAFSIPTYGKSYFNNRDQGNLTYSAGALFTYSIFPKFRIKPGFYYFNYFYNFKTQAGYINYDQNYSWLYTSAGILNFKAYMSDTLLQNALLNSKMRFTYLSIPLSVEYDLTSAVFLNIGMDMSFLIGKDFQMQAIDYSGNFDFQMEDIQKLHPYNVNMMFGLGLRQAINKNMSIIINPTLRISLTTLNNQAPVKSYPYAMGLNAGLRYYF